ncbi:MlaD family protein [Odoribacter lunatus]|uniref:MlaD family protein n=1 Tax=Odoribacter lunatus TaxID=2941335 RepID=UPI00203A8975|nr:MlaD family protein [Odoribacter lunatus]
MKIKREVKLALTAIGAIIILIWGINFLKAKALFDRNNIFYGVYDNVDGLKVSSSVVYRGYQVGQVNSIHFVGARFEHVLVQFSIKKDLEIPANSEAVIQNIDLMGSKAINIVPGNSIYYAQNGDTLRAQLELNLLEQVNRQIQPLKNKAENIMASLDTVLTVVQDIFNNDTKGNIEGSLNSIHRTLKNVESASGSLDGLITGQADRISHILSNINSITDNLQRSNYNISKGLNNIAELSDTLQAANLGQAFRRLDDILLEVDSVVRKINRGKGSVGEAINNDDLYYNLVAVSENLNKLLVEFRANPKRFVNLSVFDFSSRKSKEDTYGIVVYSTDKPLAPDAPFLVENPQAEMIKRNGKVLYMIDTYRNLKDAEGQIERVKKSFKDAYIVKIN